MDKLISSSFLALRSLVAPGMFKVFFLSVIITIGALVGFVAVSSAFFTWLGGQMQGSDWASFMPLAGSLGAGLIAWFLFPTIMPVTISFFDNQIAGIIEREDYPAHIARHEPSMFPELLHDIRFTAMAIGINILMLPLYFIPVLNVVMFSLINGYLLGREFFVMAARRHMPVATADALRKKHSRKVVMAGIVLVWLATIPIVNLFAPFWGVAVMTHLYHRLNDTPRTKILPPV